jgi:hypothetical protein
MQVHRIAYHECVYVLATTIISISIVRPSYHSDELPVGWCLGGRVLATRLITAASGRVILISTGCYRNRHFTPPIFVRVVWLSDAMASTDPPASSGAELTQDSISALEYITQQEELGTALQKD